MYPAPFVSALQTPRDYPFTSGIPMRWAWVRPMEEVRPALRKGKWIVEEEEYTQKLIECFNKGFLNISQGTTLRSCLSEKLNCDPMRITKKFAGSACIGKQIYQPCEKTPENTEEMKKAQAELAVLERKFHSKIEHVTRTHRYPYLVYGAEPLPVAPDTAPADVLRAVGHDFPAVPHTHPYLAYTGPAPPRTFFPAHEPKKEVLVHVPKAEVSPKSPTEDGEQEALRSRHDQDGSPSPPTTSPRDVEDGGLLLSFIKSVHQNGRPSSGDNMEQDNEENENPGRDDEGRAKRPAESPVRRDVNKDKAKDKPDNAGQGVSTPHREASLAPPRTPRSVGGTPKRPATVDESSLPSTRKRRVPDSFAAQAAYSHAAALAHHAAVAASAAHARASMQGAASLAAVEHRVPLPPVPPLDFQALHGHGYPYAAAPRSYLADYHAYTGVQHYLSDPLRRAPYAVYESHPHPHPSYRTAHTAHALHAAAHVPHPLASFPPFTAISAHPDVADVHVFPPPPHPT